MIKEELAFHVIMLTLMPHCTRYIDGTMSFELKMMQLGNNRDYLCLLVFSQTSTVAVFVAFQLIEVFSF